MTKLNVPEMTCGHCKATIEKAVFALDKNATISVDLNGRTVDVQSNVSLPELISAMKDSGYDASVAE